MQLVKEVSLDINKKNYQEIKAKQNDIGRFIKFSLYADGISLDITGNTVKFYGNKPDGMIVFNNITILDSAKGIVLVELTNQALAKSGTLNAELVIYGADGTEISSVPFGISIEKSIRDDSAIESQNEFTALSQAMESLAEYDVYKQKVTDLENEKASLYLQELEPLDVSVNSKTLWFNVVGEASFNQGGAVIENAKTSSTPPDSFYWFQPIE